MVNKVNIRHTNIFTHVILLDLDLATVAPLSERQICIALKKFNELYMSNYFKSLCT